MSERLYSPNSIEKDTALFISPHVFFVFERTDILAWQYKTHQQFLLTPAYFAELSHIALHSKAMDLSIAADLLQTELITTVEATKNPWKFDLLSYIYHIGTQDILERDSEQTQSDIAPYQKQCQTLTEQGKKPPPPALPKNAIKLPEADMTLLEKSSFLETLCSRKTCRNFFGKDITLSCLSTLLHTSFGEIGDAEWEDSNKMKIHGSHSASPASGALHAEIIYLLIYHVSGLSPGIYEYHRKAHALTLIQAGRFEEQVMHINTEQAYARGLSFGLYLCCDFSKHWLKYPHSKQYKIAHLDFGHLSQTFLLTATALGLHTWITGAFMESEVADLLKLNTPIEAPMLFLGAGIGSGSAIPKTLCE